MPGKLSDPIYIPEDTRATLHHALARATDAGMSADIAVSTVSELGNKDLSNRLIQASNSIKKGQSYRNGT